MENSVSHSELLNLRHQTEIGPDGAVLYHAPVEIQDQADLDNYGITWRDVKHVDFGGTDERKIHVINVPDKQLADFFWKDLNLDHTDKVNKTRCQIPGVRKDFIRCRHRCSECPYGLTPADKQLNEISWEKAVSDTGEQRLLRESRQTVEDEAVSNVMMEGLQELLAAKSPKLGYIFWLRYRWDNSVKEIADLIGISGVRIYQYLDQIAAYARRYYGE